MRNKNPECNLCGSNNCKVIYKRKKQKPKESTDGRDEYLITEGAIQKPDKIFKCLNCTLMFAQQDKNIGYYADKYANMVDEEYIKEESGRRKACITILERIEKHKKAGHMLEIGCANGFFLDEARRRNWEVRGVEISKWAASYAKEKLNLNIIEGSIKDVAFPDKFFDVIVMLDVLEHLPDPKHALLKMRKILKNDGILYISIPDISSAMSRVLRAKWWGINKFHLFYFSKKTLEKMLYACGFRVKEYNTHIRIFSISYWAKRLKVHNYILYKILDYISKIDTIGTMYLKVSLHDQIETVAAKDSRNFI